MTIQKQPSIKAVLNYGSMIPDVLVSASNGISTDMTNNPNFNGPPAPPVDLATLKTATNALAAAITAVLGGGVKAIAQVNYEKEIVVNMLVQLGHYVEANCKNDMTIFLSSGFTPRTSTRKRKNPASDSIRNVVHGPNSGELAIKLVLNPDALSHEARTAPMANGAPGAWTIQPVTGIRKPTIVSGLTPGTVYAVQARALTKTGYTDWSDSVTLMCM